LVDGVIEPVAADKYVEQLGDGLGWSLCAGSAGDGADGVQGAVWVQGDGVGGELGRSKGFQPKGEERGGEVFGVEGDDGAGDDR
jgi:hypothetical protein